MAEADVRTEYTRGLKELTFNSKIHINYLTMLADDYRDHAPLVRDVIAQQLLVSFLDLHFRAAVWCSRAMNCRLLILG